MIIFLFHTRNKKHFYYLLQISSALGTLYLLEILLKAMRLKNRNPIPKYLFVNHVHNAVWRVDKLILTSEYRKPQGHENVSRNPPVPWITSMFGIHTLIVALVLSCLRRPFS